MTKKTLWITTALILFFAVLVYIVYSKNKINQVLRRDQVISVKNHFHPDEVLEILFTVAQNKFEFKRKNRLQFWTPDSDKNQKIQFVLNTLASLEVSDQVQLLEPVMQIRFTKDDRSTWVWQTDGENFKWAEGPLKNKGGVLGTELSDYLRIRENIFLTKNVAICDRRPTQFIFGKKIMSYVRHRWVFGNFSNDKGAEVDIKKVDQNYIEKWMGRNCKFLAQTILPVAEIKSMANQLQNELQINESSHSRTLIKWSKRGFILIEKINSKETNSQQMKTSTLILNSNLVKELNDLKSQFDDSH